MNQRNSSLPRQQARTARAAKLVTTLATTLMAFTPAWAMQLDTDNPDVTVGRETVR